MARGKGSWDTRGSILLVVQEMSARGEIAAESIFGRLVVYLEGVSIFGRCRRCPGVR